MTECDAQARLNADNAELISVWRGRVALMLSFAGIVGLSGLHRFYLGRRVSGILQLATLGGLGIWQLVDVVRLALEQFTDAQGRRLYLKRW